MIEAYIRLYGNGCSGSEHRFKVCFQWVDEFGRNWTIASGTPYDLCRKINSPRYAGLFKGEGIGRLRNGRKASEEMTRYIAGKIGLKFCPIGKNIYRNRIGGKNV